MQNHHARDVIFSIPIGVICGLLAYRAHYVSTFSYPTNHIPLSYTHSKRPFGLPFCRRSKGEEKSAKKPNGKFLAVTWPREEEEKAPEELGDEDRDLISRRGNLERSVTDSGERIPGGNELV